MSTVDVNNLTISGRLVRDPERKAEKMVVFSIANSRGFGDYNKTSFFNCKVFGKTADFCQEYLSKGDEVAIIGELNQEKWEKDGKTHYSVSINAREVKKFFKGKKEDGKPQEPNDNQDAPLFDEDIPF